MKSADDVAFRADAFVVFDVQTKLWSRVSKTGQLKVDAGVARIEPGGRFRLLGRPSATDTMRCWDRFVLLKSDVRNPVLSKRVDFSRYYCAAVRLFLGPDREALLKGEKPVLLAMFHKEILIVLDDAGAPRHAVVFMRRALGQDLSYPDIAENLACLCRAVVSKPTNGLHAPIVDRGLYRRLLAEEGINPRVTPDTATDLERLACKALLCLK